MYRARKRQAPTATAAAAPPTSNGAELSSFLLSASTASTSFCPNRARTRSETVGHSVTAWAEASCPKRAGWQSERREVSAELDQLGERSSAPSVAASPTRDRCCPSLEGGATCCVPCR